MLYITQIVTEFLVTFCFDLFLFCSVFFYFGLVLFLFMLLQKSCFLVSLLSA